MNRDEFNLVIKDRYRKRYINNNPLIILDSLADATVIPAEGSIVALNDERGNFIARGYVGSQNKGVGWLLTKKNSEQYDQAFVSRKLAAAVSKRQPFFYDENTTAFRLFNAEGDGIGGITIDYYDGYYLINWYNEGIYYHRELFFTAIKEQLSYLGIYQKMRFQSNNFAEKTFIDGIRANSPLTIKENGIKYLVNLEDGLMVGIFLDQRNVREAIQRKYAKNKKVLNCFSYTGAFSIAAAIGGAKSTTSVDLAVRSRESTEANFKINQIKLENHEIIVDDVFDYFKYANRKQLQFDLIIIDPPSFARTKKRVFSVQKNYPDLLKLAVPLLARDGVFVLTTNHAGYSRERFYKQILDTLADLNQKFVVIEEHGLSEDFTVNAYSKESDYLKVVFLRRAGK